MAQPIPWVCNTCGTTYTKGEKLYLVEKSKWTPTQLMCIPCHDKWIISYLGNHSYLDTARKFELTIKELKERVINFNKVQTDPVFRHCDHNFEIYRILHKNGDEGFSRCSICGLSANIDPAKLTIEYPNSTISVNQQIDCGKNVCQFCQE